MLTTGGAIIIDSFSFQVQWTARIRRDRQH